MEHPKSHYEPRYRWDVLYLGSGRTYHLARPGKESFCRRVDQIDTHAREPHLAGESALRLGLATGGGYCRDCARVALAILEGLPELDMGELPKGYSVKVRTVFEVETNHCGPAVPPCANPVEAHKAAWDDAAQVVEAEAQIRMRLEERAS